MPRNTQVIRLLRLGRILADSKRGLPLKALAERHDWPLRTLYRDIEALEESGFHVIRDEDRFRIPKESFYAPEDQLQADERLALFTARQLSSGLRETTTGRALEKLWQRLSGPTSTSPVLVPLDEGSRVGVRAPLGVDYGPHRLTIQRIEESLAESRPLECHYQALSTGETTARIVEPGALHWDPALEALYLIAWCRLRSAVRVFAVHRVRRATLLAEKFTPRPECRGGPALRSAFRVWRSGNIDKIVVRLSGWAAREAQERKLHPSQQTEALPGGEARVTLEVSGLEEAARWILGYGALAVVERPAALIEKIRGELQAASSRYPRAARSEPIAIASNTARKKH